jgi:predicted anti-sigma-YlaC factor YlaD
VLNLGDLGKLLRAIADTRETEIDCEEGFERMDHFAEMELSGMDAGSLMPLVSDHLCKCEDCREKFEALLRAMRAT